MDIASKPPRLLAQVRAAIRVHQLSPRTEQAYLGWVRRYVRFHGLRHPATMGTDEAVAFLSHLATEGRVVQSTQMQALSALLLLYRDVIRKPLLDLRAPVRARAPARLPVVLSLTEVEQAAPEYMTYLVPSASAADTRVEPGRATPSSSPVQPVRTAHLVTRVQCCPSCSLSNRRITSCSKVLFPRFTVRRQYPMEPSFSRIT